MDWIVLIPLLPAAAFAIMLPMTRTMRKKARWVSLTASLAAMLLSIAAFVVTLPGGGEQITWRSFWAMAFIGKEPIGYGVLLDTKSALMLLVVTIVGFCVQVYSNEYMKSEDRIGWYYAVLSLFTAAMLTLVLADNYLQLYMAWEVMGLCSYLLIGFWNENEAPRQASLKAFLTTRVGDLGLALALPMIWALCGSFRFEAVFLSVGGWAPYMITTVALLLFLGAMGKSAQFPLHVWLPDAMAGPTPASALIHAATMVAAGVWLVLRSMPIFERSHEAMFVVLVIGGITTIVGSLLAMVQHDVKKVLAYSTISQLGLMFLAIGGGAPEAAFFLLIAHAFFKAPLFLGAGVIIHASHTQDMREMNGLLRATPWTAAAFTIGTLALMGIPPLSGFFSKDGILTALWNGNHRVAFGVALLGAILTAFYMSRLWFRIFPAAKKGSDVHEGPAAMVWPTMALALITVALGLIAPMAAKYISGVWEGIEIPIALASVGCAALGIAIGWWAYGRRDTSGVRIFSTDPYKTNYFYTALVNKLYIDQTYEYLVIRPYVAASAWLADFFDVRVINGLVDGAATGWKLLSDRGAQFDTGFIDAAVDGVGILTGRAGAEVRRIQSGRVQTYQRLVLASVIALGVFAVVVWAVLRGA